MALLRDAGGDFAELFRKATSTANGCRRICDRVRLAVTELKKKKEREQKRAAKKAAAQQ
jgi:hypothetical protein